MGEIVNLGDSALARVEVCWARLDDADAAGLREARRLSLQLAFELLDEFLRSRRASAAVRPLLDLTFESLAIWAGDADGAIDNEFGLADCFHRKTRGAHEAFEIHRQSSLQARSVGWSIMRTWGRKKLNARKRFARARPASLSCETTF